MKSKISPSLQFTLKVLILSLFLISPLHASPKVLLGIDRLMDETYTPLLKGKKIGLITNQTGVSSKLVSNIDLLKSQSATKGYSLVALFAPEHGINGAAYANQKIEQSKDGDNIPIFSLYGKTRRPTDEMLKGINLLLFDIQDIGSRSYTYITTMFYAMEEAAKKGITFVVLDRPNPINGITVDGPMLEEKWRSILGYINIPYCHGMTIGELAKFFNAEYNIGCKLEVIPMKGWKRSMSFPDTGLTWIPTSPYVPEASTPFYYSTTGIIGEMKLVNIGIGYTLPFKLIGAPWINAKKFAEQLNNQKFAGVHFEPFYFKPMYGRYAKEECQGVLIVINDSTKFKPVSTQYLILGTLKAMYPKQYLAAMIGMKDHKTTLCKLNGSEEIFRIMTEEKFITWKLCSFHEKERVAFLAKRKKYLLPEYDL